MSEEAVKHQGLGRGLSALLGNEADNYKKTVVNQRFAREALISQLRPGKYQPRRTFSSEDASSLVESIRQRGILQPILVRQIKTEDENEVFEIVAGERRWRAAQEAQLHQVPIVVKELTDEEALEVALVENLQREDLLSLEEAEGFQRIIEEFGYTQEQISKAVGKSRSHVANMLRLLSLSDSIKKLLNEGQLSVGHAKALIGYNDPEELAKKIISEGLSVRQTEFLTSRKEKVISNGKDFSKPQKSPDEIELESRLSSSLGLHVAIKHKSKEKGQICISYTTLEQLDDICRKIINQ